MVAPTADDRGNPARPQWWLTQDGPARQAFSRNQRLRYQAFARVGRAQGDAFADLYRAFDVGRCGDGRSAAGQLWWTERRGDDEVRRVVRRDSAGAVHVVFDPAARDRSNRTILDGFDVAPDGLHVAVWTSTRGQEDSTLRIIDTRTSRTVAVITDTSPDAFVWAPDSQSFYAALADEVVRRRIDGRAWERVTRIPGGHVIASLAMSPDATSLVIGEWLGDWERERLWIAGVRPGAVPRLVHGGDGRSSPVAGGEGMWLVTTVGADRGRLVAVDPANPSPEHWRTVLAPSQSRLRDVVVAAGRLVAVSSYEGADRITLHDRDGTLLGRVTLPGRGEVSDITADGDIVHFTYSDPVTPPRIQRFDVTTGRLDTVVDLPATAAIPGVRVESTVYPAPDGTLIPIDLIYRAVPGVDAPRPTILHAYGGFLSDDAPAYGADVAAWVAAGGVYAHAHVRGGDIRSGWHRNGPDGKEQATADLAAAAAWLIAEGRTSAPQLGLLGGSNGGWLVTATAVRNPGLVGAVVAQCGVLDLVEFARFGPGRSWVAEYGDARDPEVRERMRALSPLHNVVPGTAYPPMLFPVGDDPRVLTPAHTYRMLAELQGANPRGTYLMREDRNVGHGFGSRSRSCSEMAETLAFFARHLGLALAGPVARRESPLRDVG